MKLLDLLKNRNVDDEIYICDIRLFFGGYDNLSYDKALEIREELKSVYEKV